MNKKSNIKHICAAKLYAVGIVCSFALSWLVLSAWAQQAVYAELKAIKTDLIHGYCVGLYGQHSIDFTNNTTTDDMLDFVPWTTNNYGQLVVPIDPEYAYQVTLLDANGVAVPKTALGRKTGTKFFDFDADAHKENIPTKSLRATEVGHVTGTLPLFRPDDLFKIEKPGNYTLQIRFQILTFPRTGPARRDYTNELIRFPILNYPLVQTASQTNVSTK